MFLREVIYWHVWGACTVFQAGGHTFSALDTDSYLLEPDKVMFSR